MQLTNIENGCSEHSPSPPRRFSPRQSVASALTSMSSNSSYSARTANRKLTCCNLDPRTTCGRRNEAIQMSLIPMIPVLLLTAFLIYNIYVDVTKMETINNQQYTLLQLEDIRQLINALQFERQMQLSVVDEEQAAATVQSKDDLSLQATFNITNSIIIALSSRWQLQNYLKNLAFGAHSFISSLDKIRHNLTDDHSGVSPLAVKMQFYADIVSDLLTLANDVWSSCCDDHYFFPCYRLPFASQYQETFLLTLTKRQLNSIPSISVAYQLDTSLFVSGQVLEDFICDTDCFYLDAIETSIYIYYEQPAAATLLNFDELYNRSTEMTKEAYNKYKALFQLNNLYLLSSLTINMTIDILLMLMQMPVLFAAIQNARLTTRSMRNLSLLFVSRNTELQKEKKRTEVLLTQMLPKSVYHDLQQGVGPLAEEFDSVTVMFTDIADFNEIVFASQPLQVVSFLNSVYSLIDNILENHDVYKVRLVSA